MSVVERYLLGADVRAQVHRLLDSLESGDAETGEEIIHSLFAQLPSHTKEKIQEDPHHTSSKADEETQRNIYKKVGQLTRDLHESLKNFGQGGQFLDLAGVELPDARARLIYVIEKTKEAANKTMDKIELAVPIADTLKQESAELLEQSEKIARKEMSGAEFREFFKHFFKFLQEIQIKTERIHALLSEIVLAQDFQDLTGQVLTKVIKLVTNLEDNLLKLITLSDDVPSEFKMLEHPQKAPEKDRISAEGPQIDPQKKQGIVSGQDDVDALLSSLGF